MFEQFPYTDMHQLNLDWIIKIAKDFLDQYTHIQDTIQTGLDDLDAKAEQLETGLQAWYDTHSADIANQLADALQELNTWYTEHQGDLNEQLAANIQQFSVEANRIAQEAIESIPSDYSDLSNVVNILRKLANENNILNNPENHLYYGCYFSDGGFVGNEDYNVFQFPVKQGKTYVIQCRARFIGTNTTNIATSQAAGYTYTADIDRDLYVTVYVADGPDWYVIEQGVSLEDALPYGEYGLNPDIIKQEMGNDKNSVMSQKAITEELSKFVDIVNDKNILNYPNVQVVEDKYYYQGGYTSNEDYCVFIIPVTTGTTYVFAPSVRFLTKNVETIALSTPEGYSYTATANENIFASIRREYSDKWIVVISPNSVYDALPYGQYGLSNSVLKQVAPVMQWEEKYTGDAQNYILGDANSIKRGKVFKLAFDFTTFNKITLDLEYQGGYVENSFTLTTTNFIRTVEGQERTPVPHNLTLADRIYITVTTSITGMTFDAVCGDTNFHTAFNYVSGSVRPRYEAVNMTISNVVFSWACTDFNNDIWLFGDSYMSYAPERWLYYLVQNNLSDNCLIDAYPGEDSPHALASLKSYIDIAKPKMIVWALGMNDGNETSEISTQWKQAVDEVIQICEGRNIRLILATIPSVPSTNHDYKNAWIRESGYQYIDFAQAVGADISTSWYSGMLSSDNIHPTVKGAKALYEQALADCPQLMVSK